MHIPSIAVGLFVGLCVGAWGYRYMLKRDPAKLESWAADLKAARAKLGD